MRVRVGDETVGIHAHEDVVVVVGIGVCRERIEGDGGDTRHRHNDNDGDEQRHTVEGHSCAHVVVVQHENGNESRG